MTWNDFRHKDEWDDYRLDTPMGGDPLQDLEDKEVVLVEYESAEEVNCPLHSKEYDFKDRWLMWAGDPPCYCLKLPAAVLLPKKFRWWSPPWVRSKKKAMEGKKIDFFDHDYDDRWHRPAPDCDCISCSCTCVFCIRLKEENDA
jgi:hypothetical protein